MAAFGSIPVDLSDKIDNPGESFPFSGAIAAGSYQVGDRELSLPQGGSYDVVFTNAGDGILLTGIVRADATGVCDRCLEPASFEVSGEIEEYYLFEEPEDPESYEDGFELVGPDRVIDLGVPVSDAVIMDTPFVILCQPDCKGLCPVCGCNLNETSCDCVQKEQDDWAEAVGNPFAALKDLKLED